MREKTQEFLNIKKERIEDIGRCELCGSKRGLDLHHIVPVCAGGNDSEDNLILLCCGCHGKLTPKSTLTKIGLNNAKKRYSKNHKYEEGFVKHFIDYLMEQMWAGGEKFSIDMVFDFIDGWDFTSEECMTCRNDCENISLCKKSPYYSKK